MTVSSPDLVQFLSDGSDVHRPAPSGDEYAPTGAALLSEYDGACTSGDYMSEVLVVSTMPRQKWRQRASIYLTSQTRRQAAF